MNRFFTAVGVTVIAILIGSVAPGTAAAQAPVQKSVGYWAGNGTYWNCGNGSGTPPAIGAGCFEFPSNTHETVSVSIVDITTFDGIAGNELTVGGTMFFFAKIGPVLIPPPTGPASVEIPCSGVLAPTTIPNGAVNYIRVRVGSTACTPSPNASFPKTSPISSAGFVNLNLS